MVRINQPVTLLISLIALTSCTKPQTWANSAGQPAGRTAAGTAVDQAIQQPPADRLQPVSVAKISDGDTITLTDGRKLRFCGIDAPETPKRGKPGQPLGEESEQLLTKLLDKAAVSIVVIETDKYGRSVAEVWKQSPGDNILTSVNVELARQGMAWHYAKYSKNCPNQAAIELAEGEAKQKKLGIWQGVNVPPWEFRKSLKR